MDGKSNFQNEIRIKRDPAKAKVYLDGISGCLQQQSKNPIYSSLKKSTHHLMHVMEASGDRTASDQSSSSKTSHPKQTIPPINMFNGRKGGFPALDPFMREGNLSEKP